MAISRSSGSAISTACVGSDLSTNSYTNTIMHKVPGVLFDRRYYDHTIPTPSQENANRVRSLYHTLEKPEYAGQLRTYRPREATIAEIEAVHSSFYLEQLREHANADNPYSYDRDTYLMERSLYTAALAAGGCMEMADRIVGGEIDYGL